MTEFEKSLSILKNASRSGSRLGLERIYELVHLLGDPQDSVPAVHTAGTNGKGSFCAMLSAALTACGYRTGTFSSPAMLSQNDCIRINGEPVSKEIFADAVIRADRGSESMADRPTEFELLTAAAFLIFLEQGCEVNVIECGMGGDGDSTNVISRPLLSVITNVTIDHCAFLGSTVPEIAEHKAGIIKEGVPVFFGGDDPQALEVVRRRAERKGSKLYTLPGLDICTVENGGGDITVRYKGAEYSVPLRGSYQSRNLLNVLACTDILRGSGLLLPESSVRSGLAAVRWEGRFEKLCDDPLIIFDGAHNRDGMFELCRSIRRSFKGIRPAVLIGVLADKDYASYAEMLSPLVCRAFAIAPDNPRALPASQLADCFVSRGLPTEPFGSIADGFAAAADFARENSLPLLVIGSLYMYRDIRRECERQQGIGGGKV